MAPSRNGRSVYAGLGFGECCSRRVGLSGAIGLVVLPAAAPSNGCDLLIPARGSLLKVSGELKSPNGAERPTLIYAEKKMSWLIEIASARRSRPPWLTGSSGGLARRPSRPRS